MKTALETPVAAAQRLAITARKLNTGVVELQIQNPTIAQYTKHDKAAKSAKSKLEKLQPELREIGTAALEAYNINNRDNAQSIKLVDTMDGAAVRCTVKDQYTLDEKLIHMAEAEMPREIFQTLFIKETVTRLRVDAVSMLTEMVKKAFGDAAIEACMETVTTYRPAPKFEDNVRVLPVEAQKLVRHAAQRHAPTLNVVDAE